MLLPRTVRSLCGLWISVSDKTGLEPFARGSPSSAGSSSPARARPHLAEHGLESQRVERLTDAGALGGRVKTLHPRIHAAILARPSALDATALEEHEIRPFDLVCVNLYPFERVAGGEVNEEEAVELIDIGGPALLRAAAKNFARVAPVSEPGQYAAVLAELRADGSPRWRRGAAWRPEPLRRTAYEARIAAWFAGEAPFPSHLHVAVERWPTCPTARTRTSAPPSTPGRPTIRCRASSSSTGGRSPTSTCSTWRRLAACWPSCRARPA